MKFAQLLNLLGGTSLFSSCMLLAGKQNSSAIRQQLNRWVSAGHIMQLRRGLYQVQPPYTTELTHPYIVANHLKKTSYVSLQSALSFHGLIPEETKAITSVTTGRPETLETAAGRYIFKHIKHSFFSGYIETQIASGVTARIATPEKALIDLLYFAKDASSAAYLEELRLETRLINWKRVFAVADTLSSNKVLHALTCLHLKNADNSKEITL